ncbi:hypothetical protein Plim_4075 [Planctopirus limnophila DSM 3776]|uniref:Uncharacterized protein n=1 Tax=Planctopirus limnophila (strain ATCC 43296 / DSM 3776 / IFAM 1008 / Mu 290) TaxID=521674 RepID=D5SY93_PLAL2|nr:hypothetical protein Plim_4075 [Planctopirus limnophila DSM 3776]
MRNEKHLTTAEGKFHSDDGSENKMYRGERSSNREPQH